MNAYNPGDKVDVSRWDKSNPSWSKLGSPANVVSIFQAQCESGTMVTLKGTNGKIMSLDSNWLRPWTEPLTTTTKGVV